MRLPYSLKARMICYVKIKKLGVDISFTYLTKVMGCYQFYLRYKNYIMSIFLMLQNYGMMSVLPMLKKLWHDVSFTYVAKVMA